MNDIELDFDGLLRQAGMTAEHYLNEAYKVLKDNGYEEWTVRDAIELCKVMAQDYHSGIMCIKIQETRDAIYELSKHLKDLKAYESI